MLKKIAIAIALFALPLMGVSAQTVKLGFYNTQAVITDMPEFIKAQSELKALADKYQTEMKRTETELNAKYTQFMQQKDSLPQAIAERRQKEIEEMGQRAQQYQQDAQQGMQTEQEKKLAPIYQKIESAVKAIGQEGGFTCIFDQARTQIPYINESMMTDLTSKIKARVGATGRPAAAPAKKK
jgi:outer membrane protein